LRLYKTYASQSELILMAQDIQANQFT